MTDSTSADGTLVGRFLSLKRQVLGRCQGDPSAVGRIARADNAFRRLCSDLEDVAMRLRLAQNEATDGVIFPVSPEFIREWRDFDKQLSAQTAHIFFCDLFDFEPDDGISTVSDEERRAEITEMAAFHAQSLDVIFDYVTNTVDHLDEDLANIIEEGLKAWDKITKGAGLDIEGTLRRANLFPRLLIPQHVSNTFGASDRLSLLQKWRDARTAFVFGATLAATAMTRSILETCLKESYKVDGKKLPEMLKSFYALADNNSITVGCRQLELIKFVANRVLHSEPYQKDMTETDKAHVDRALKSLETWTAEALLVLRSLIEETPSSIEQATEDSNTHSLHSLSGND